MSGSSTFTSILWWIHDTNRTSVNCEGFATKHSNLNVETKYRHLLYILHSSQYRCINWRMLLSCYCSMKLSRHPDSALRHPPRLFTAVSGQQRYNHFLNHRYDRTSPGWNGRGGGVEVCGQTELQRTKVRWSDITVEQRLRPELLVYLLDTALSHPLRFSLFLAERSMKTLESNFLSKWFYERETLRKYAKKN